MNEHYAGTMPLAEANRFDLGRLQAYMRLQVDGFGGKLEVEQFKGGQSNPTFRLSAGGKRYVLRRKPMGTLLPSAHAIEREYRVIKALAGSDVPVAHAYCLCEDNDVIGSAFYIMDCVEGRVLWEPALPGMQAAERAALFDEMNRIIATLHKLDYQALGLADYGKPGNYFARQIARWSKQYRASETEHIEAMENLIAWLPEHIPAGDESSIVHGDFRIDNMIFHRSEPRVLAVLDWELSTLGHPLADIAYHCMSWHVPGGPFRGLQGLDLEALGIPAQHDYLARYCQRVGRAPIDPRDWDFYIAYNMFRGAGIAQGVMGRVADGTAASARAQEVGSWAPRMAASAWQLVEKIIARQ